MRQATLTAPRAPDEASAATPACVLRLALSEFRNYARVALEPGPHSVVLTGPNGAGKTNLLEALSFLAPGRGLRRARLAEVDRRDGGRWAVSAELATAQGPVAVGTGRDPDAADAETERRVVRIDGEPARGAAAIARHLGVAWLVPAMDRLFTDGPSGRRRFVDRMVSALDPDHAGRLAAYEHAARERGRLLAQGGPDPGWLDALEARMAEEGTAIAASRLALVRRLDGVALAPAAEDFPAARLAMAGALSADLEAMPALAAEDRLKAALRTARAADAESGAASAGPQRDDLSVVLAHKDTAAAQCSTGEQKALLVGIVLAHARLAAAERGQPPVLLLDEVAAHLDAVRRQALFAAVGAIGCQAWMTGTDDALFAPLRGRARFFRVVDGAVLPR